MIHGVLRLLLRASSYLLLWALQSRTVSVRNFKAFLRDVSRARCLTWSLPTSSTLWRATDSSNEEIAEAVNLSTATYTTQLKSGAAAVLDTLPPFFNAYNKQLDQKMTAAENNIFFAAAQLCDEHVSARLHGFPIFHHLPRV